MPALVDLGGKRFGRLLVQERSGTSRGNALWSCTCDCGATAHVVGNKLTSGHTKSCGCLTRDRFAALGRSNFERHVGAKNPAWKGGRKAAKHGYVYVLVGADHPMANSEGYCFEHRLVMSDAIGRPLRPEESVHHINEVKNDNRIENLMLFPSHGEHMKYHWTKNKASEALCA